MMWKCLFYFEEIRGMDGDISWRFKILSSEDETELGETTNYYVMGVYPSLTESFSHLGFF